MIPFGKADRPDTRAAIVLGVNEFVVGCAGKPGGGRPVGTTSGDIFGPVAVTVVVVAVEGSAAIGDSGMDGIIVSDRGRILTDRVADIVSLSSSSDVLSPAGSSVWSEESPLSDSVYTVMI